MIRIFVDSGSSIKQDEKQACGVEIFPLRYLMGENEYNDGIDMPIDEFYRLLIEEKLFPKTSLPCLEDLKERVSTYTQAGDKVIVLTISSKISGSYEAIKNLFKDDENAVVIDTLTAVGGIRILVDEIHRYENEPLEVIVEKVNQLIPKIRVAAIPETLDYLLRGGRLSKNEWVIGSLLNIKPIISLNTSGVKVIGKKIGLRSAMKAIATNLMKEADLSYPIVPSYTYCDEHLRDLIDLTDEEHRNAMIAFDNLDPVIACHWGPNAFGFIYVSKE